jgi:hypothetical protein
MLASKYFPHYLGLNCLYYYLAGKRQRAALRRRDLILLFGTSTLLFVLFNPVVLLPTTLRYMLH